MENNKCLKCDGLFVKGQIFEKGHMGKVQDQEWGTEFGFLGVKDKHSVISYRCTQCGYLESYAK